MTPAPQSASIAQDIQRNLASLAALRRDRERDAGLVDRVVAVKRYQQQRFRRTYADLIQSARYAAATQFFLDELYGPVDFSERDAQFERIVPTVMRMFPVDVLRTVAMLAELHALSESLDTATARAVPPDAEIDARIYVDAWAATGRAKDRERQIALTLGVGQSMENYTHMPALSLALRSMRAPARAAGLSQLQRFLESGFETFKTMHGSHLFLETVAHRERLLASALFGCPGGDISDEQQDALGQLP